MLRAVGCGGRRELIERMPRELKVCLNTGGNTTLMVWADLDDNMTGGEELKARFWQVAQSAGVSQEQFAQVVFVFAKDRLENWIQYLNDGSTDESVEGPRVKHNKNVADAARKLAHRCRQMQADPPLPPSLDWSCKNWRQLVERMSAG